MSEHNPNTTPESTPPVVGGHRRRFFTGLVAGGALGALLAGAASAWSHADGPGGWHGRGWCRAGAMNPAAERDRIELAADWILNKVKATEAQREQVKGIVLQALQDLAPARDEHRERRDAFLAAVAQPAVDRAKLDELRRAELQLAEQASSRVLTALVDIAEVLTPEQRAELVKLASEFRR